MTALSDGILALEVVNCMPHWPHTVPQRAHVAMSLQSLLLAGNTWTILAPTNEVSLSSIQCV
jgi:hypothetical protein